MERKSFVFYDSYFEAISAQSTEICGEIYTAIIEYGLRGVLPENPSPIVKSIFVLVKPQIDANNAKYVGGCKGSEYGKKGGRPKGEKSKDKNPNKTPNKPLTNPKGTPNDNENDNENDNVNDISSPTIVVEDNNPPNTNVFIPPSLVEMQNYFDEKGYTKEAAEKAYDYYTELRWIDSKGNAIKNWKLKCLTVWFKDENKKDTRPWGYSIAL